MALAFRARCSKHKKFRGQWTYWRGVLVEDLKAHIAKKHPKCKNPKKAIKKALKKIKDCG